MAPSLQPLLKLGDPVDPGIYRSPQFLLRGCECIGRFTEFDITQHQNIDIARGPQRACSEGAINAGIADLVDQRGQGRAKQVRRAHRLFQERAKNIKNGRGTVRLIEDLPAPPVRPHQSYAFQGSKLALSGACAGAGQARELAEVKGLLLPGKQKRQQLTAPSSKEQLRGWLGCECCTHGEY